MRLSSVALLFLVAFSVTPSVDAKEGVKATIHTPISPAAIEGSHVHLSWSLADEKSNEPFSACAVFIRLIGPTGASTEAFAECGLDAGEGNYSVAAVVPCGGISKVEIGIAGTITDGEGKTERSDWLIPLASEPTQN